MKRFIRLSAIILLGVMLLSGGNLLIEKIEQSAVSENILQEANELFLEGLITSNFQLLQQSKDKFSLWLDTNSESADKKTVVQVLRSRANVFMTLNELTAAVNDYDRSNQDDPIGEIQLGICFLNKQMSVNSTDLQACYQKAVNIFSNKKTDKTDINYLIARILSGDESAIAEYKSIVKSTEDPNLLDIYEMAAQEYFDKPIYQKIYGVN